MLSFVWNNPTKTDEIFPFIWNNPTRTEERSKGSFTVVYCWVIK